MWQRGTSSSVRDDDWNRVEFGKPYIECEECKTKYKIIERHFFEYPWKGDGVCYYLFNSGYKVKVEARK